MNKTVWVDGWQMQCCGQPFTVGTTVSWTLREADPDWLITVLGPDVASTVDAAEEHHSDAAQDTPTTGTVGSIQAVHCRYGAQPEGDPRMLYPMSGSGVITDVGSADGWTPDQGELQFAGYLVRLELPS